MFLTLQPKFAAFLFPSKRAAVLKNFLSQVQQKKTINAQDFWQFREFISPGSFHFNPETAEVAGILNLHKIQGSQVHLMEFTSPVMTSSDQVITRDRWIRLSAYLPQLAEKMLFANQESFIFYDHQGDLHILFVKPIEEMATANGFFDYTQQEKEYFHDYYWFNDTRLSLR